MAAPENTIAAFELALEQGADGIELDVHRSLDGALVVHHDADASGVGLLVAATFAEIRAARPDIPTLAETFAVTGSHIVNVEIKCCGWDPDPDPEHTIAASVVELVRDLSLVDRVVISSFDLSHIDAVRALDDDIDTGFLVHGHDPTELVSLCAERGHRWLHPDWGNLVGRLERAVESAHAAGVRLDAWTVDDPLVMQRLAATGVDAFITNDPALALRTL